MQNSTPTPKAAAAAKPAAVTEIKAPAPVATPVEAAPEAAAPAAPAPVPEGKPEGQGPSRIPRMPEKPRGFEAAGYPYKDRMNTRFYEKEMQKLQIELLKAQSWVKDTGQKVVILFEGRDAAGKGGTIKRYHGTSQPARRTHCRAGKTVRARKDPVVFPALHQPSALSRRDRLLRPLLVQPRRRRARDGLLFSADYLEFMRQCPDLERMLVRSGIHLFKYWFSVTRPEQFARFKSRETDPLKQWKLSPIDKASLDKWDDYTEAKEAMFFYTDTADAPWTIIKSDDKKRARLACMRHFLSQLDYAQKDEAVVGQPDPLLVGSTAHVIGNDAHIIGKTLHPEARKKTTK
jgi:polyphosphate kinase 2 (PPK2 family)